MRITSALIVALALAACSTPAPPIDAKTAFERADRVPQGEMTTAEWTRAKQDIAVEALAALPDEATGEDRYYVGMLERLAGRWEPASRHLQNYLTAPETGQHENRMNRLSATTALRDAFIQGGLVDEAERHYASDPIALALFVSRLGDDERTLQIYDEYLASDPPPDRARTTKSLIVITLGSMNRADEMADRLDEFFDVLTPNNIVNAYATLTRLYVEGGERAKGESYRGRLFDYALAADDAKSVDGPTNAHINWTIARLESAGDAGALNDFLYRVRTDLAGKPAIMANLDSRDVFRDVIGRPAPELEIAHVVGGSTVTLESLRGRVVLLDFLAHWCGPCIAGFPMVTDLQSRYETEGLTVLGLTGVYGYYRGERPLTPDEEVARMRDHFVDEFDVTFPLLFGLTDANNDQYGVSYIPHLVLIDRSGVVRFAKVGSGDPRELEQEIRQLLAESGQ